MTDRIATRLLLVGRDAASGRLRYRTALEKALRGALFADLALQDSLVTDGMAPVPSGDETGDKTLDSVRKTVADRPDVAWWRWFRHTTVDRVELTRQLVESGRWTSSGNLVAQRFTDNDSAASLDLGFRLERIGAGAQEPADASEAVLAIFASMCGAGQLRPRGRFNRDRELTVYASLLDRVGMRGDPRRDTVQIAVLTTARAIRRRRRLLG